MPVAASTNGRARIGKPGEPAVKFTVRSPRKKPPPCKPTVWFGSNQKPSVKRAPERASMSMLSLPKSVVVPGAPSTPAMERGVPGGLVVMSAGSLASLIAHSRYSALNQTQYGLLSQLPGSKSQANRGRRQIGQASTHASQHSGAQLTVPQSSDTGGATAAPGGTGIRRGVGRRSLWDSADGLSDGSFGLSGESPCLMAVGVPESRGGPTGSTWTLSGLCARINGSARPRAGNVNVAGCTC